jgi:hypothetical protein
VLYSHAHAVRNQVADDLGYESYDTGAVGEREPRVTRRYRLQVRRRLRNVAVLSQSVSIIYCKFELSL